MLENLLRKKQGYRMNRNLIRDKQTRPKPQRNQTNRHTRTQESENKKGKLKCVLINARSIINKKQELEAMVLEENPDLIFITETWADEIHSSAELKLSGYDCHRNDRQGRGGGCIIYAKEDLKTTPLEVLTNTDRTDTVWCKVEDLTLGVCYNTTANSVEDEEPLLELMRKACLKDAVITGDFNHESIDWELMEAQAEGQRFLDQTQDLFLHQHVEEATRGENILDLILSTNQEQLRNVTVTERFGTSDHNKIKFEIVVNEETKQWKEKYRDYRNADFNLIRNEMRNAEWREVNENIQTMWDELKDKLEEAVVKHVKVKERIKGKPPKPMWWNRKIYKLRRNRLKWWQRFRDSKDKNDEERYLNYQKQVNREVKEAKRKLEERLSKNIKEDRKGFYKYQRSTMKIKEAVGPIEDKDGNLLRDEKKMAEAFGEFFKSVFTKEDTENIPEPEQVYRGTEEEMLTDVNITEERVLKKLKQINPTKAPGNDNINAAILKESAEEIAKQVTNIFRKSLDETDLPEDWKSSNITPIFKKDSRKKVDNYRGVHLTAQLCKTMESLIKEDIVEHIMKNKLMKDTQHGFQSGKSCFTNLLLFLEEVTKNLDEGKPVDILYMDFKKAFDSVPHQRLLKKLKSHGISGKLLDWIEEWLCKRRQRVVLKGKTSEWEEVTSGVPQGSVLGPLLFIIFINDIESNIVSTLSKFADDCKITSKVTNDDDTECVQEDVESLGEWSDKWQLIFHPDKCKTLHLGYNNRKKEYSLKGNKLKEVAEEKDLGIIITQDMKFKRHIAETVKKANKILGMIRRSITCKDQEIIMRFYKSLVRPILDYGSGIWNPYQKQDIEKIEKIQRRATKMIRGMRKLTYGERLRRCKLMTLEERRRRYDLIETFKIMKGIYKIDKTQLFEVNNDSTRGHGMKIRKKYSRLNLRKYFFSNRIVNDWNRLPEEAVKTDTVLQFKKVIDPLFYGGLYMIH